MSDLSRRVSISVLVLVLGCTAWAAPAAAQTSLEQRIAAAVLSTLNAERHAHGLAPLRGNVRLARSARAHDLAMARHDQLSHQLPGEAAFGTRISRTGYRWRAAAENIAVSTRRSVRSGVGLQRMMYAERPPYDDHRRAILSRTYRDVGVDAYVDPHHHRLWITVDFGRR